MGRIRGTVEPTELKVSDLVRKNVSGVDQSASFRDVISLIEHSHDNTYAVTNDENAQGIIQYDELSRVMFDQSVADLVRADDLCSPALWKLYLGDSAETAVKYFRISNHDCILCFRAKINLDTLAFYDAVI